jgi:hypothetical protein
MVTEPTLIGRWASAPVRALRPGHDNHPTALGATRSVALPLGLQSLKQVVSRCDPPRSFAYQTVSAVPGVRSHSGVLSLTPAGLGTRLAWVLELTLSHTVRGLEPLLRGPLTMAMRRELVALKNQLAVFAPPEVLPLPPSAAPHDEDLAAALTEVRAVLEEQRALCRAMQAACDPKHFYLHLCQLTTEEMLLLCESGQLPHPSWALRLVALQHTRFLHNLRRWLSPNVGPVEPQWQSAFTALDLAGEATTVHSVLTGLHLALRAQLEYDLPLAVAQTLRGGLVGDCARFRADLFGTSMALRSAMERLLAETAAPHLPRWLARSGARLLGETLALLLRRYVYDVVGQRSRAFERGVQLAGQTHKDVLAAVSVQPTAVPNLVLAPGPAPAAGPSPVTSRTLVACETALDSESDAA